METSSVHDASALLAAAAHLEESTARSTSPAEVAAALIDVEATLRALDRTCLQAGASLIPPVDGDEGVCARYRSAAERWPGDGAPPSYERQAQILARLHDAGATLRAAAECCGRARDLLARVTPQVPK